MILKLVTRFDPVSAEPSKQVLWRHRPAPQTFGTLKLRRNRRLLICSSTATDTDSNGEDEDEQTDTEENMHAFIL